MSVIEGLNRGWEGTISRSKLGVEQSKDMQLATSDFCSFLNQHTYRYIDLPLNDSDNSGDFATVEIFTSSDVLWNTGRINPYGARECLWYIYGPETKLASEVTYVLLYSF